MSQFTYFNYYCMTNYEKRLNKTIKSYFNEKKNHFAGFNICYPLTEKTQKDKYKIKILWIYLDKRRKIIWTLSRLYFG
jgi:hypothetical protein